MIIKEVTDKIEAFAPLSISQEAISLGEFDNSGFLIGEISKTISGIVVCIDVCHEAIELAVKNKCNLIVSHHPFIYHSINSVLEDDFKGKLIRRLIKNDIAVYSTHLCMDMAVGGIDDTFAEMCGIKRKKVFEKMTIGGYGKFGLVDKTDFQSYIGKLKEKFDEITFAKNNDTVERVVSFCGGGVDGDGVKFAVKNKADTVISCDIPHHYVLELSQNGINVINLSHGETELKALWEIIRSLNLETKLVLCEKDFRLKTI